MERRWRTSPQQHHEQQQLSRTVTVELLTISPRVSGWVVGEVIFHHSSSIRVHQEQDSPDCCVYRIGPNLISMVDDDVLVLLPSVCVQFASVAPSSVAEASSCMIELALWGSERIPAF